MKKQYKKPITESVKVSLYGSVLDAPDTPVVPGSPVTVIIDAKEQGEFFEDDGSFGDIWGDGDSNDLWE